MATPNYNDTDSIRPLASRPISAHVNDLNIISSSLPNHPENRLGKRLSRPRLTSPQQHRISKSNILWEGNIAIKIIYKWY
jgi:hypothetical protein